MDEHGEGITLDQLDDALDTLRVGLMLTDVDDVICYANAHVRLNYPELTNPVGRTLTDFFHAIDARLTDGGERAAQRRATSRNADGRLAIDLALVDGRTIEMKERARTGGGSVLLWSDVTDARRMSRRLEDAIMTSSEGFAFFLSDGRLDQWNDGFAIAFGGGDGVVRGDRLSTILSRASQAERIVIVGEPPTFDALAASPDQRDYLIAHADGRRLRLRVRPARERGVVAVLTDVTADASQADTIARRGAALAEATTALRESRTRMRLQTASLLGLKEELHRARRDAQEAQRAKQAFLRTVTHELRTPLNAIIGFSEIMEQQVYGPIGSPKYAESARYIVDSGHKLLRVVSRIVDMTRLEAGLTALTSDRVEVAPVIDRVIGEHSNAARIKRIQLISDVPDSVGAVWADEEATCTILNNLLENAIEHTPPGGLITVAAREHDGYAALVVTDTGTGIAPADLERVLLPFEQAGAANDGSGGRGQSDGAGLGLPVVKALAEAMNGAFELASTVGLGTRAVVTLPSAESAGRVAGGAA